jgi:subtilase family serine protease
MQTLDAIELAILAGIVILIVLVIAVLVVMLRRKN